MGANFFDALGLTDREKVHSAMLAWIFSEDNDLFNNDQKYTLIKEICSLNENFQIKSIKSFTEIDYIDVQIILEFDNSKPMIIFIENKIKASQGYGQLKKYNNTICKKYSDCRYEKLFLTLIEEKAMNEEWKNISYDTVYDILNKSFKNIIDKGVQYYIFNEYLNSLNVFLEVKKDFLKNYFENKYDNVFTDGSKKKSEKQPDNYIAINQLETILQKCFLNNIRKNLDLKDCDYYLTETRGNADLSIVFKDFKSVGPDQVQFDFAFQNGTFKLAVSKDYWISKKIKKNCGIVARWEPFMKEAKNVKVNVSKNKPRISLTWKFPFDALKVKAWYKTDFENMIAIFNQEINRARLMQQEIVSNYNAHALNEK